MAAGLRGSVDRSGYRLRAGPGAARVEPAAGDERGCDIDDGPPTPSASLRHRLACLPRNVVALGVVSFVADFSSEMIYPVFPGFVTRVLGASAAILGLIEGTAEATASLTRYPFGRLSDESGRRRPFVLGGYGLAALGKLVLALAFVWPVAFGGRVLDRTGKGMRTAPRDALLATDVRDEDRGLAFGLHRTMDTVGAVVGPLVTLLLLELGVSLRWVFALAVVPGAISVVVIWKSVRERPPRAVRAAPGFRRARRATQPAPWPARSPPVPRTRHPPLPPACAGGCACPPRAASAACSWPRSSSPSATRATPSSCSRRRRSATERRV